MTTNKDKDNNMNEPDYHRFLKPIKINPKYSGKNLFNQSRKGFHVTVVCTPSSGTQKISLDLELSMLKGALLYTDKATLISLQSTYALLILQLGNLTNKQKLEFIEANLYIFEGEKDLEKTKNTLLEYSALKKKKHLNMFEQRAFNKAEQFRFDLLNILKPSDDIYRQMAKDGEANQLLKAVESGLLQIEDLRAENGDAAFEGFFNSLTDAMSDGSTYPLLDFETVNLLNVGKIEGKIKITDFANKRRNHIDFVLNAFYRLPYFELAGIDEILDIRRELDIPLVRFRKAMLELTSKIEAITLEEEFIYEVGKIFETQIAVSVLEIEEAIKTNSFLSRLTKTLIESGKNAIINGGILTFGLSNLDPSHASFNQLIGVSVGVATVGNNVYKDWKEKREGKDIKQNDFYFYYASKKYLENNFGYLGEDFK